MGIFDSVANVFGASNGGSPSSGGEGGGGGGGLSGSSELPAGMEQYSKMQGVLGTLDQIVKAAGTAQGQQGAGRMAPLGLDAIIQDWVRQQFIYRRSILQDLYVLAYQVTEIRSVVLAIQREVFRRGFGEWTQKFVRKCVACDKKVEDEEQEHCDECYAYEIVTQRVYDKTHDDGIEKRVKRYKRDSNGEKIPIDTVPPDRTQQPIFEKHKQMRIVSISHY